MSLLFSKSCLYYSITWCLWEFEIFVHFRIMGFGELCRDVSCCAMWVVWWFTHRQVVRSVRAAVDEIVVVYS